MANAGVCGNHPTDTQYMAALISSDPSGPVRTRPDDVWVDGLSLDKPGDTRV